MEKMFLTLLEISAGCAVVILIISLLSSVINRRFTAKWKYFIWIIIAVRLLVPFNPSFDIGQPKIEVNIPNSSVTVPSVQEPPLQEPPTATTPPEDNEYTEPVTKPAQSQTKPAVTVDFGSVLWQFWLVGTAVFLGIHIGSYALFRKKLFRWARPVDPRSQVMLIKDRLQNELDISEDVPVLISAAAASPMMLGFFRSVLVLPHEDYSDTELYFILRHELTHFKRRDIWYKLLMVLANAVHWFNPLVWLMVRESDRDLEISCDSIVVRGADAEGRRFYSQAILSNVHRQPALTAFTTHFYGGKRSLKERFKNILNTKKRKAGLLCFGAVILCIGLIGGVVSCSLADDTTPPSSEDSSVPTEDGLFKITSFIDQEKMMQRLTKDYPVVSDWEIVYEYHDYATEENLVGDGLYSWQGDGRYTCCALLSTSENSGFDRVFIGYTGDFILEQTEDGAWTAVPAPDSEDTAEPYSYYYKGFEENWQFGDCEGAVMLFDRWSAAIWFPEKGEAFFDGINIHTGWICLKGITEKPRLFFSCYSDQLKNVGINDSYIIYYQRENRLWHEGEFDFALYRNEDITLFEGVEDLYPSISVIDDTTVTIETNSNIYIYDLSRKDFGEPAWVLGGNGKGLSDSDVYIIQDVFTDGKKPTRHCVMYYIEDERKWRICSFEADGTILDDFSTGLEVIDETITSITFQSGLVYFSYRPEGATGKAIHYCLDARPGKNHTPQRLD